MPELPFLESYGNQSIDDLLSLRGSYRDDSIVLALEDALQRKGTRLDWYGMNNYEMGVLAVEGLEREVNNGGYLQFFLSAARAFAPWLVPVFKAISCPKAAELTQHAFEALGLPATFQMADTDAAIERGAESLPDILGAIDEQFYDNDEDIGARLLDFVATQRHQFSIP